MKKLIFLILCNLSLLNSVIAQWQSVNSGSNSGFINALAVDPATGYLYAGLWESGILISTNNGITWNTKNLGLTDLDVFSIVIKGSNIFAGTIGGGVFLSTNNGNNWNAVNNGISGSINTLNIRALAINGINIFAGTGDGIFLSTNEGSLWTAVNNGLPTPRETMDIVFSGINTFAGFNGGSVYLSANNGSTWNLKNTGLTSTEVESLLISGSNLFAGTFGSGIFLSKNNANNWTAKNTGLTNYYVESLIDYNTNILAGTSGGVFLSTDNGDSWISVSSGLPNTTVNALVVCGDHLFAGTDNGIYKRLLSELGITTSIEKPEFNNINIYPNPAKQFINIDIGNYSEYQGNSIKIINMLGMTVFETKITQPQYELNTSSWIVKGVYFLEVYDSNKMIKATEKIILQ
jgi:photosystem II stability/assembly factor-like uncharacterized protein